MVVYKTGVYWLRVSNGVMIGREVRSRWSSVDELIGLQPAVVAVHVLVILIIATAFSSFDKFILIDLDMLESS
jgi:hypothetical protein